jgi:hypothetical protein
LILGVANTVEIVAAGNTGYYKEMLDLNTQKCISNNQSDPPIENNASLVTIIKETDSTDGIQDMLALYHTSTGEPTYGLGSRILLGAETYGCEGTYQNCGGLSSELYDNGVNAVGKTSLWVQDSNSDFSRGLTIWSDGSVETMHHLFTADGGIAEKYINKTGAASVKGTVVCASSGTNNGVGKIVVDIPDPIGVIYNDGVADGSEVWVVTEGKAKVYFTGSTTRKYLARGFITGDAGYVSGQAFNEALPSTPFATDKHFYEIGHVLEARTGAGLALTKLHFN